MNDPAADRYLHGYSPEEQARLVESRGVLVVPEGREDLVHGETCSGEGQTESIMIAPNARIIDRC